MARSKQPSGPYQSILKGVSHLSTTGYIQVRAYTSFAAQPLANVAVAVTAADGTAIGMRLTDRSGKIAPIAVSVPPLSESQTPDPEERPYTTVNLYARLKGYEQIEAENLQVFADITTVQDLELIPLSELPGSWDQTELLNTPPQNL